MDFKHKNILVCGMAASGISAARLLKTLQARVTLQDKKERSAFAAQADALEKEGVNLFLGSNPDAIISQFDLVVVSPGIPSHLPFFSIAKKNNIPIISEIELSYLVCPATICAITGTNGKTTTTALVGEIFRSYYTSVFVVGNIGEPFSGNIEKMDAHSYVICELSSFQLENIRQFKPKISAVLNIAPDHIDWHKNFENYVLAKEKIFANQDQNDYLILNYEDAYCRKMAEKATCRVVFFSGRQALEEGAFIQKGYIHLKYKGVEVDLLSVDQLKILGSHNTENALAASFMAYLGGVPVDHIKNVLQSFSGVSHRLEYVATINGIDFYNDSKATNVDSAIKAIDAIPKPIVLIGGGYDKNVDFDEWIKSFAGKVKSLIVIGQTAQKIIACAEQYHYETATSANSLEEAVKEAYEKASFGDCVLLSPACASWGMFDNYEQRGNLFKKCVLSLQLES